MQTTIRAAAEAIFNARLFLPLLLASIVIWFSGCSSNANRKTAQTNSPALKPGPGAALTHAFDSMPSPQFRKLVYEYSGERGRKRTEFTLLTNNAANSQLAFVNYLTHGINPGLISGYGELLPIATVSSNTLPVVRTIQHVTVSKVTQITGELFPLRTGNVMELRVARVWEQRDPSDRLLDRAASDLTLSFRVMSVQNGFEECKPPVAGEVFVIEQHIQDGVRKTTRQLHFAVQLGACVRILELENGMVIEEAHLTGWEPLLYRQRDPNVYEH